MNFPFLLFWQVTTFTVVFRIQTMSEMRACVYAPIASLSWLLERGSWHSFHQTSQACFRSVLCYVKKRAPFTKISVNINNQPLSSIEDRRWVKYLVINEIWNGCCLKRVACYYTSSTRAHKHTHSRTDMQSKLKKESARMWPKIWVWSNCENQTDSN